MENGKWEMENWSTTLTCILHFALCTLLLLLLNVHGSQLTAKAADMVYKASVTVDQVPKDLFGTWRVSSKLTATNTEGLFKEKSVDLWNLSRVGDVIKLDNPFSGANASIVLNSVSGRAVKFKRIGDYDNKKLTDTVQLVLEKDSFRGVNNLKMETISEVDGHVMKTEWATYSLLGEKISGESLNK